MKKQNYLWIVRGFFIICIILIVTGLFVDTFKFALFLITFCLGGAGFISIYGAIKGYGDNLSTKNAIKKILRVSK